MELYFTVKATKHEDKVPLILLAAGEEGLRRYNSWSMTDDDRKDPQKYSLPSWSSSNRQPTTAFLDSNSANTNKKPTETTDIFVNRCRLLAKKCDFTADEVNERLVELLIASTPIPELQKELLNKPKGYKIEEAVKLARSHEASAIYVNQLQQLQGPPQIATINRGTHQQQGSDRKYGQVCKNCGRNHRFGKEHCRAKNDTCNTCGKVGHWATVCFSGKHKTKRRQGKTWSNGRNQSRHPQQEFGRKVDSVAKQNDQVMTDIDTAMENLTFSYIETNSGKSSNMKGPRNEAFVDLSIKLVDHPGTHTFNLKVDTGAQANTLPIRIFRKMYPTSIDQAGNPIPGSLTSTQCLLTAYNNTKINCYGTTNIRCKYKNSPWMDTQFYVVDVPGAAILGLPTSVSLKVVTMNCAISVQQQPINSVADLMRLYPDRFDRIGEFRRTHKLAVNPNVPCHIDPPRRTPIAMREKIKAELDKMESQGVIRRIEEPTNWVSSLTYVTKRDNTIRVCLDPRALNKALIRPYHQIPTVEELNHRFAGAKFFSKFDAKSGYWSIKLDRESQPLTTFQTPFGRYCFERLPFGLSVSQDIYQLEMDRILEKCTGACGIADDITIYGSTEHEHDKNLKRFLWRSLLKRALPSTQRNARLNAGKSPSLETCIHIPD
ncbi:unnamed protein product [Acanthosepion pharaonis]|uniref:Reverse transcriptase domain-containing protein n=1 Tax=Acanthosepion pharaonis TaxID=158019 RepID=A0A812DCI8_ACAPH|nr:unnamed protein product [Sepia pharaonis]